MEVMTKYGRIRGFLRGCSCIRDPMQSLQLVSLDWSAARAGSVDGVLMTNGQANVCNFHEPGSFYEKEFTQTQSI